MSLQGFSDAPDPSLPPGATTPPAQPGDVPLPVRARSTRGGGAPARAERPGEDEPFSGGPLFMPNASDAKGVSYAEKFAKHGLTEADRPDLGLRLRLIAPDPSAKGGTTRVGFASELLHPDSPPEAIHDRWGPGLYEVALCWKTAANRTRSAIIERRLSLPIRTGGKFGPDGEYDVGRESWPVDLDVNSSVPAEVRDEIERREDIRAELNEIERGGHPHDGYDDPRGGYPPSRDDRDPRGYGGFPPPPPAAPLAPMMPPAGSFPLGTSFMQVNGQWVAQTPAAPTPAKPSVVDGFLEKFTADPVATASSVAAALAALKGIVAPPVPPPPPAPTAQDIAAAVAAALAPVLQAVTAKPSGLDPEVLKAQLQAEREAAERRIAEERAARAAEEARRERERAEERVKQERERAEAEARRDREAADRDRQFQLQLAGLRSAQELTVLRHQVEMSQNANASEKASLLKELDDVRKKLRSGEEETPLDWSEKLATIADTEFGKAAAPKVLDLAERVVAFLTGNGAQAAPAPAPAPAFLPPAPMAPPPFSYAQPEAAPVYPTPAPPDMATPTPDGDEAEGDDPEAP